VPTSKTEQARLATLTPVEYCQEQNAETRAWVEANPGSWASMLTEDPEDWAHCANGLEVAFELACADYSDWYKEENGIRPRWARFTTLDEVEAALAELAADCERRRAWEAEREKEREAERAREAHAAHVEALLAPVTRWMDRAAAMGACGW
jgi:hypothetical protein